MKNYLKRSSFPLVVSLLFLLSLFLPYDNTVGNGWGIQDTGWIINLGYIFAPVGAVIKRPLASYLQLIAFIGFLIIVVLFLVVKSLNAKLRMLAAFLSVIALLFLGTPYLRPILFHSGFDVNMITFYLNTMRSGYYISLFLALLLVVWMFYEALKSQKQG